jgi:hypothetical protein
MLHITVPALTPATIPCQHAWVFSMTGIQNFMDNGRNQQILQQ